MPFNLADAELLPIFTKLTDGIVTEVSSVPSVPLRAQFALFVLYAKAAIFAWLVV